MDQAEILRRWVKRKEQGFEIDTATFVEEKIFSKTRTIGVVGAENELVQNTNLLANIAVMLSKKGKQVLIIEAHKGKIDSSIPLGLNPKFFLEDLLYQRNKVQEVVNVSTHGVKFVKVNDTLAYLDRLEVSARNNFFREWALFEEESDMVFVNDTIPSPILNFSELLILTSLNSEAITSTYEKIRKFMRNNSPETKMHLVVNMCSAEAKGKLTAKKFIATAKKFLNLEISETGVVVLESEIIKAIKTRMPFVIKYPYADATNQVSKIAQRLLAYTKDGDCISDTTVTAL